MALGLESKRGALRKLGEEFPDEKAEEIFEELKQDAIEAGALRMAKAMIDSMIISMTGLVPGPDGSNEPVPPPPADGSDSAGPPAQGAAGGGSGPLPGVAPLLKTMLPTDENMQRELATLAFGTKLAQRRNPDNT